MSDGAHSYSYDAEGKMLSVDSGNTAQYVYDAMNHRVRVQTPSATNEFLFDDAGRRISTWRVSDNYGSEGRIYWDGQQFAFRDLDGTTYFDHQDWIGTERARTNYAGTLAATYWSLPFGDDPNQTVTASGPNQDNSGFAYQEFDPETLTDHAQYRQYNPAEGRWFSPDPYDGSYDMNNPQSFNRYSYVMNSPVAFNDPSGQFTPGPALYDSSSLNWIYLDLQQTESLAFFIRLPPKYHCDLRGNCYKGPAIKNPCLGQALQKNGVALVLDLAGVGAGFLPGGDLVVEGAQIGVGAASTVNSAIGGDLGGSLTSIFGIQLSALAPATKWAGVGAKAVPVLGAILSTAGALNDAYQTYQSYQSCIAGHS